MSISKKLKDFCNMKKAINTGLLEGIEINMEDRNVTNTKTE
jgi:hypothetical protein